MADLNVWAITGRLTKDAEYRMLASGKALLSCNVAVNTGWGEYKKTTFVKVNQWGERGANLCSYLKKGKQIAVSGSLSLNTWQGRDGKEHTELVLETGNIQLLGGDSPQQGTAREEPKPQPSPSPVKQQEEYVDEVPF